MTDTNDSKISDYKEDSCGDGSNKIGDKKCAENKAVSTNDPECSTPAVREEDKVARAELLAAAEKWEKIQRTYKSIYPF